MELANLFTPELIGLYCIVSAAIIFMFIEKRFPYNPQATVRSGFWMDLFWYTLVQSYILGVVIYWILSWVDTAGGFERWRLIADWPLWVQVVVLMVLHDIYIYWFHRLQHANKYLWRLHEAHHSTEHVDWLSGIRSHPVEILINQTIEYAPMILLGADPLVFVIKGTFGSIYGMYIHSNLDVRMGWLQYVINGPEMHRWHHANCDRAAYDKNFSTKFACLDWIFGTAFLPDPKKTKAADYGLPDDPEFPMTYWGQTFYAFRRMEPAAVAPAEFAHGAVPSNKDAKVNLSAKPTSEAT